MAWQRGYDNRDGAGGRLVGKYYYTSVSAYTADKTSGTLDQAVQSISYAYDSLGRVTTIDDDAFATPTTQAYDAEGRLTQIASPQGVLNYAYDDLGRLERTWTSKAANGVDAVTDTRYTYDRLGRLKTVDVVERFDTTVTEDPTTYVYDKNGNLDRVDLPNGVVSDYVYDDLNRLELLRHFKDVGTQDKVYQVGDTLLAEFDYQLRADGKRTSVIETNDQGNTNTIDWIYDELGRLTEERFNHSLGTANDFITRYGFDLASNRVLLTKDTGNANPVTFTADETTSYQYDENDRLDTEIKDAPGTTDDRYIAYSYSGTTQSQKTERAGLTSGGTVVKQTTFTYNVQGRLQKVEINENGTGPIESTTTYEYNDSGIRVSQTENGTTTVFHIDPNNHTGYAQVLEEGVDDNSDGKLQAGEVDKSYALGLDVISQATAAAAVQFLLYDGHGSTRALLNTSGAVATGQRYAYDAYGNMQALADHALAVAAQTSLLYSGERTDKTGLQYLRARYYDPRLGRFNRLDPFAGNIEDPLSLHKYLYGHGDPTNRTDPLGLFSLTEANVVGAIQSTLTAINVVGAVYSGKATFEYSWGAIQAFRNGEFWDGLAYMSAAALNGVATALNILGLKTTLTPPPALGGIAVVATAGAPAIWQVLVLNPAAAKWVISTVAPIAFDVFVLMSNNAPIQEHHKVPHGNSSFDFKNHELVKRAGIDLFDDSRNKMLLANHGGRHARSYLETVKIRLDTAWQLLFGRGNVGQQAAERELVKVINKIEDDIANGSLKPYVSKDVWIP